MDSAYNRGEVPRIKVFGDDEQSMCVPVDGLDLMIDDSRR